MPFILKIKNKTRELTFRIAIFEKLETARDIAKTIVNPNCMVEIWQQREDLVEVFTPETDSNPQVPISREDSVKGE